MCKVTAEFQINHSYNSKKKVGIFGKGQEMFSKTEKKGEKSCGLFYKRSRRFQTFYCFFLLPFPSLLLSFLAVDFEFVIYIYINPPVYLQKKVNDY